jgi:hypothetical protein
VISVVNGYVCTSSCEAASARAGKDPNAPSGTPPGQSDKTDKTSALDGQPATALGGTLKDIAAANAGTPSGGTTPPQKPVLNLLA